ncbi:MAG: hypothetical protein IKQ61_00465 [Spirochaetales bacterium]|nr:hypothetical protein [Spirochaetales bacterium]
MADEEFDKGYLENSAVYYKSFINSNPDKRDKILAYQKLFEIDVLQKNYYTALDDLAEMEKLDSSPFVYVSRLRLLLRLEDYTDARKEIERNYPRMKKSVEYKELVSVFFMKTGEFHQAISELSKIPFAKREFDVHKRILHCYIKLNQISNAMAYSDKIESKIRTLNMRDYYSEFAIIRAILYLLRNDVAAAKNELEFGQINKKYHSLVLRLQVYANILDDKEEFVISPTDDNLSEIAGDTDFIRNVADYFYYKKNYPRALEYYTVLADHHILKKDEVMAMADLYYKTAQYDKSIEMIRRLTSEYSYSGANYFKNLAVNYKKMQNYQQAVFYLREGLDFYRNDVDFYIRLASLHIAMQDYRTALQYVSDGKDVLRGQYDRRLDILRIQALTLSDVTMSEQELLALREQGLSNPEYYFKLIEHYISNNRFPDAKRELDTVSVLDLSVQQQQVLNVYKLYFALKMNDTVAANAYMDAVLAAPITDTVSMFNHAVINILRGEYDKAINTLVTSDRTTFSAAQKGKLSYLIAVCYYMKRDYGSAYKYAKASLALRPSDSKASYLMSLISE